jgi:hypothetical protein
MNAQFCYFMARSIAALGAVSGIDIVPFKTALMTVFIVSWTDDNKTLSEGIRHGRGGLAEWSGNWPINIF